MLYSLNFRPDIIALTETRMSPNSRSVWVQTFQSITFSIPIHLLLQVVQLIREFRGTFLSDATGSALYIFELQFWTKFWANRLYLSRHIKSEQGTLLVDVHCSQTSLLTLPIMSATTLKLFPGQNWKFIYIRWILLGWNWPYAYDLLPVLTTPTRNYYCLITSS